MKNNSIIILLLSAYCLTTVSCTKDELPKSYFFSKIMVTNTAFPNSPDIDVRFEGKKLGTLAASKDQIYDLSAGQGVLKIYKANTDRLLADTLITLVKNKQQSFRYGYSEELGISGWITSRVVPSDSVRMQFLNNLGKDFNQANTAYDFYLYYYDFLIGDFIPQGFMIADFQKYRLYQTAVIVPYAYDYDRTSFIYYCAKLKDKVTGEFIVFPSGNDYFMLETASTAGGIDVIYNINDSSGELYGYPVVL